MNELRMLTKTVCKNHHEADRRLTRMEVSINKTLVQLGDITRLNAVHSRDFRECSDEDVRRSDAQTFGDNSRRQRHNDVPFRNESSRRQQIEDFGIRRQREDFGSRQQREDLGSRQRYDEGRSGANSGSSRQQSMCELPISNLSELTGKNLELMDKRFFSSLVSL